MKILSTWLLTTSLCCVQSASAFVVYDPANFIQNQLNAVRSLQQINNQVRQLQHESQMLSNDSRNLTRLDYNVSSRLQDSLAASSRLLEQAQGLSFAMTALDREWARVYPQAYGNSVSGAQMARDTQQRWLYALQALQTTMRLQSQITHSVSADAGVLQDLVTRSQGAVGQLQATQATNQLLALQAHQSMQSQQLQLSQDRAVAVQQARAVAAEERAREVRRRFLAPSKAYRPVPVNFYGR